MPAAKPDAKADARPDTKTRILDKALELFNAQGAANVTTNHIAEALTMSPGNLYYHFRNKGEIVVGLFARIKAAWAENYALPAGKAPSFRTMDAMAAGNFAIQWQYRFFFRDLTPLLSADPKLAEAYRANRAAGMKNTVALLRHFISAGLMAPADKRTLEEITELLWLTGDFWLVFREAGGHAPAPADIDLGVRLFRRILAPHIKRDPK
jgi:AcrR family transcriptional regulator